MLTKMIFKLLFKALVPIVAMVGLMSYGMYMKGGDPAGMFKKVLGDSIQSAKSSVQGAGDSLKSASPVAMPSSKTTVYQWVDENGVTQFGSSPPEGIVSTAKTFNNNANLMAATPKPQPKQAAPQNIPGLDGEPMPGVAGMNLPVAMDPEDLSKYLQTMQRQE